MAYSDLDDVDYLVEDNAMDDLCLPLGKDRAKGKPTFEDVTSQNFQFGMLQPSYLPEIQIWLVTGYFRLNMSEKKNCNTNRQDNVARFSGNGLW